MLNKRGVSPLIATSILIGFAVVITTIVILFGGELIEEIQQKQGKTLTKTIQCDNMHFKVTDIINDDIWLLNDETEDIHAFMLRYKGDNAEYINSHLKTTIPAGGSGKITAATPPGIGELKTLTIFAKSVAGPEGSIIWGTCGSTETSVNFP